MNEEEARIHFELESGKNQSDRMVYAVLGALAKHLDNHIIVDGNMYDIRVLGAPTERNGEISLMFDVKDLPGFDHIEFTIKKTGWGRNV